MCGLCLPHCPTFRLSGVESQSPRGRIALARQLDQGIPVDASVSQALESCLQCRACEAVCPAQVRYGDIIEGARERLRTDAPSAAQRMLGRALQHPHALARWLGMGGALARLWPALTRSLGKPARWLMRARWPLPASATTAETVLFAGCVAQSFEREAQQCMLIAASAAGQKLELLKQQGCCGAWAQHQGNSALSERQGQQHAALLARAATRTVVALDSGCISALRKSAPAEVTVSEACRWLLQLAPRWKLPAAAKPMRIGWFAPCTHRNVLRDAQAAAELLAMLPDVDVIPLPLGMGCCGAAGPHLLAHPDQADALAEPIVDAAVALELDALATTNVGCALHLSERLMLRGITLPVRHPVAFLADLLSSTAK